MEVTVEGFERDLLFLSVATENLKKYNTLGFQNIVSGGYQLHLKTEIFEQLASGREVLKRHRKCTKYPTEKYIHLHGIEVICLCEE